MSNILIISGHPHLEQSLANRIIIETLENTLGKNAVRRLDILYPDYQIDIAAEQEALLKADIIIWQFPYYWYSLPALMKKWLDDVFVYGFSHGSDTKLAGKKIIMSFTTGAPAVAYDYGQAMNYPVKDFLPPLHQTAMLCKLDWQTPIYSQGMTYIEGVHTLADKAELEHKATEHGKKLLTKIANLIQQENIV